MNIVLKADVVRNKPLKKIAEKKQRMTMLKKISEGHW